MSNEHQPSNPAAQASGATFQVEDMTCGHCVGTIRKALEGALPGTTIAIDLEKKEVAVAGNAEVAAQAIRAAGYQPRLLGH